MLVGTTGVSPEELSSGGRPWLRLLGARRGYRRLVRGLSVLQEGDTRLQELQEASVVDDARRRGRCRGRRRRRAADGLQMDPGEHTRTVSEDTVPKRVSLK